MKRIFTLLALAAFALTIFAQSPDLMTYQAVLRDAENHLLTNQAVAVQISILQTTPNGTAVFTEVHSLSTNANGLISLVIGDGIGDDLSLVDWSSGPYFLKTETDPAGGSNYTITSTSQLLSVPYAQYADEAGNIFSGAYGDLTGAPTVVSAFANDEGYITGVTGSETAFDDWDKNVLDDFSGNYGDLTSAPTAVSAFTNDAGYLTSELWSQNGSNLYYQGGDVGIGTQTPTATLDVEGDAKFGSNGIVFTEMREITGTTPATGHVATVTLPTGYHENNTRILSLEINWNGTMWTGLGYNTVGAVGTDSYNTSYRINEGILYIYYPELSYFSNRAYRILIMQIAP